MYKSQLFKREQSIKQKVSKLNRFNLHRKIRLKDIKISKVMHYNTQLQIWKEIKNKHLRLIPKKSTLLLKKLYLKIKN